MKHAFLCSAFVALSLVAAMATPTENLSFRVLPAPAKMDVDGKTGDWDLSGGIFACDDVEAQRGHFGVWLHAQYDTENLYLLARWNDDTPLNNPGQTLADYGFAGDSLQFRTVSAPGTSQERGQHFTAWRGHEGADVIKVEQGKDFKEGVVEDAKKSGGAQQAFRVNADGKGYVQEIAIPWKLLTRGGQPLAAGGSFTLTFEPNFTIGAKGRASVKDLFKPGLTPDRVFTFMSSGCWGRASLEARGNVKPQPVRLADAREFAVRMELGVPVVDWTGLIKTKELAGFKPIEFTMPVDGYLSLNIQNADGLVVRQLLNAAFFTKGNHAVNWDGLTTPSWTRPGEPVPPGEYRWSALIHTGIGLKLRGWACNGGVTPWDSPDGKGNWGGDHGVPVAVAAVDQQVYLGWSGAEAGKAVLACDLRGRVQWSNNRGGMAGVKALAADAGVLYVLGGNIGADSEGANLYKLNTKDGSYLKWEGSDRADLKIQSLWPADAKVKPEKADGFDAMEGRLYLSFTKENLVAELDGKTGRLLKTISVKAPSFLCAVHGANRNIQAPVPAPGEKSKPPGGPLLFAVTAGDSVTRLDPDGNEATTAVSNLTNVTCVKLSPFFSEGEGASLRLPFRRLFVGLGSPVHQVRSFTERGLPEQTIGRVGGRTPLGQWMADGFVFPKSLAFDRDRKLWIAENDGSPKRFSVWNRNAKSGEWELFKEFFGPTSYGALGGAICPTDPDVMVGQGCEWRLDPQTGRARCTAVITRDGMENSRFAIGANGKVYLAVASKWAFETGGVKIFEHLGDADYRLRCAFRYQGKDKTAKTILWTDANGDEQEQPEEITIADGTVRFSGWYMNLGPDLVFTAGERLFRPDGFTACGAPRYDLSKPVRIPASGLASADGAFLLQPGSYGETHTLLNCFDIATGKRRWSYPDNFNGVHGSHNACPPQVGMIRGSYGPCGSAKLPKPVGNIWVIPTNVGEWHILTEDGFYLTRLFEGDPMKVKWPTAAVPGADMSRCPPGMGGEDFGGSIAQGADGRLYVQAGKTAFWNLEVTGLESVKAISGKSLQVSHQDVAQARKMRDEQLQSAVGTRRMTVEKFTPKLTGNFEQDFAGAEIIRFQTTDDTAIRSVAVWDEQNICLAWDVRDKTPWVNGAEQPENLYLSGDTVDFQLGTDSKADLKRDKAGPGDLRVSIGNFKGTPTAVIYRPVADNTKTRQPRTFTSGVIKAYVVADVQVLADAQIKLTRRNDGYVIEAVIPFAALEFTPVAGQMLRGDFGVTYGDPAGQRTRLRFYWNNQHTGIVDDAVFELMLEPKNWGELLLR